MKRILILALALALFTPACSWLKGKPDTRTAEQLVADGVKAYDKGDYTKAIEAFEKLKDWYPFSKYAILAELKVADAYYFRKNYEDAAFAYEHFESLHPRNEAVAYVIFQIGMCHFKQIRSTDRDQTPSRRALESFRRVMRQYPDSAFAPQAMAHAQVCMRRLAEHDFYVGSFYYKMKKYKAALARFEWVLSQYPDVGVHERALNHIARCQIHLAREKTVENTPPEEEQMKN